MADPVGDIIGDYRAFSALQHDRLLARGIDIRPYPLSHVAVRVPEWDQYAHVRNLLERHAVANRENVWNGRPISLIVPAEPLEVLDGKVVPLIELIPPVHQRVYKMGLEHLGVVVGDDFRRVRRSPQAGPDGTAVPGPEQHTRPRLHLVRGLHPREVLSTLTEGIRRARCWPVRRWVPSRRRLGAPAARHRDRSEPLAALSDEGTHRCCAV